MISWFKDLFRSSPPEESGVALQPPGEPFPWPRGARLTALEALTLAIPAAALGEGEKIGSLIHGDADMEVGLPGESKASLIYLRLKSGASVSLSKSVQGVVVADDKRPKRIRVSPPNEKEANQSPEPTAPSGRGSS